MARFELTEEQFHAAIAAAAKSGAEAALAGVAERSGPAAVGRWDDLSPNEQFLEQMKERRGARLPPIPTETIKGLVSDFTGSTFSAEVQHGIVVTLGDYAYPTGFDSHQEEGGIVPNRMTILDTNGQPSPEYRQWRWENFYQADLRSYVGKALPKHKAQPVAA